MKYLFFKPVVSDSTLLLKVPRVEKEEESNATNEIAPMLEAVKIELTPEVQKKVARGFDRLLTKIDANVDTKALKEKVELARKEKNLDSARDQFVSVGIDLNLLLKSQELESYQAELDELRLQIDPEYKALQDLTSLKLLFSKIPKWALPKGSGGDLSAGSMKEVIERFYVYDDKSKSWKARTALELAKSEMENTEGFFSKGLAFVKGLFVGLFARNKLVMAEGAVTMGHRNLERVTHLEAKYEGTLEDIEGKVRSTAAGAQTVRQAWKDNPELLMARREADRVLRTYGGKHHDNLDGFMKSAANGRNTDKALKSISEDAGDFMQDIRKNPALEQELIRRHQNGQQLGRKFGVELRRSGGVYAFSISVQAMREAIKARDPEVFIDNISNSEVLTETIPFVGSKRSIGRLRTDNGDPMWAKGLDVGVNVIGDGVMVVGMVGGAIAGFVGGGIGGFFGGFGVGAIPGSVAGGAGGAAGGAAIGAGIKSALVGASKWVIKGVTNLTSKASIKGAGKAVMSSVGKQTVKRQRVVNEFGDKVWRVTFKAPDGVEMMVEAATKKELKKQMTSYGFKKSGKKFANKGLLRETLSNGIKLEAITAGFSNGMNKLVERIDVEDRLIEVGTRKLKEHVSPTQAKLFQTFTGRSVSFMS